MDFRSLKVYEIGFGLAMDIFYLTKEFPEIQSWLEFAYACEYINKTTKEELNQKSLEVGKLLNYMINNPAKFGASKE